jgi:hypothetical protein
MSAIVIAVLTGICLYCLFVYPQIQQMTHFTQQGYQGLVPVQHAPTQNTIINIAAHAQRATMLANESSPSLHSDDLMPRLLTLCFLNEECIYQVGECKLSIVKQPPTSHSHAGDT